ncbi:response regulator [Paenibacillus sp. TRM 82003]|nr:response regulator [Paenibacillus sp. TRM 82003]
MFKILIVDDERIEREGLRAMIERGVDDVAVEEAPNGSAALEVAGTYRPDLVFMDIKMPGMSGLEAVERMAAEQPGVRFVMVTAFDTFEYARQAIKLGVKDYLLKPSKAREIVETVKSIRAQIEEERRTQERGLLQEAALKTAMPLVETDVVTQLLFDHVHEVHLEELVELLDIRSANEMFVMTATLPPGSEALYSAVKERIRQAKCGWVGAMNGRQIPIIVFRESSRSFRAQAVSLAQDLLSVSGTSRGAGWFVGIGNTCDSLRHIRQSYQESLAASMDSTAAVKYRFYADAPADGGAPPEAGPIGRQRERQLLDAVRLGQWDAVETSVMDVIARYENEGTNLVLTQQRMLELLWVASRMLNDMGVDAEAPTYSFQSQDFRQLRGETARLLERLKEAYNDRYSRLEPDAIHRIKQYIEEHSHEDISLDTIGRVVALSPFYISKMFKEQLGVNYIDYLTECRIEKAKRLMADPEKSLKEITFEVGYHDPNYFSKVFKKMCGLAPTEFRRALLQGNRG